MFLVSSYTGLCPIHWSQVLSREWICSWSSADRRCSNYICMINNLMRSELNVTHSKKWKAEAFDDHSIASLLPKVCLIIRGLTLTMILRASVLQPTHTHWRTSGGACHNKFNKWATTHKCFMWINAETKRNLGEREKWSASVPDHHYILSIFWWLQEHLPSEK